MKNPIMIVVLVIVIAVVGFGVFTFSQKSSQSDSMMKKDEAMMQKESTESMAKDKNENAMMQKDDSMMEKTEDKMMGDAMADARYIEYSKTALDTTSNRRVLFFYASWCPTCKSADASFTENESKIPGDVTLIRVNYNDPETDQEEKNLGEKYGITYQHTYVQIDKNGKEITKWNGGQIDELLTNIK